MKEVFQIGDVSILAPRFLLSNNIQGEKKPTRVKVSTLVGCAKTIQPTRKDENNIIHIAFYIIFFRRIKY